MNRCLVLFFVIFLIFLFPTLSHADGDYSKPVFNSAEPSRVDILGANGDIKIKLKGKNLMVLQKDCKWNARRTMLFVRHTARGNQWQGMANNFRLVGDDSWPNPPRQYGHYGCYSNSELYVTLPRSIWCTSEGDLEFMLTKGITDYSAEWYYTEQTRSNVFRIPVVANPNDTPVIAEIRPEYYFVGQKASSITVIGTFRNDSMVEIDGKVLKTRRIEISHELIVAELPYGFGDREAMHMVRLVDPEGNPGQAKPFWVYGPVRVVKCTPQRLNRGLGQADITLKFGGLRPFTVQGKMVPDPGSGAVDNSPPAPSKYVKVPFSIPAKEKINVILSKKWMAREGKIYLKLVSSAGDAVQEIPVVPSRIGKLITPGKMAKTPILTLRKPDQKIIFRLPPLYKKKIKNLAAFTLKGNPDQSVIARMKQILIRYSEQTGGTGAPSEAELIDALKQEAMKELVDQERQKDQERIEAQREHIKKLISLIKEMWKVHQQNIKQIKNH